MSGLSTSKLADLVTYVLSVAFAAGCVAFAGYKVIKLQGMENPPVNLGLNFPPPKRKIITDQGVEVDPITTRTVMPDPRAGDAPVRPAQPYVDEAPVESYALLTVIDGVAFVELTTLRGKEIVPVAQGGRLPGAGAVDRIERIGGAWVLTAGEVSIVSAQ